MWFLWTVVSASQNCIVRAPNVQTYNFFLFKFCYTSFQLLKWTKFSVHSMDWTKDVMWYLALVVIHILIVVLLQRLNALSSMTHSCLYWLHITSCHMTHFYCLGLLNAFYLCTKTITRTTLFHCLSFYLFFNHLQYINRSDSNTYNTVNPWIQAGP